MKDLFIEPAKNLLKESKVVIALIAFTIVSVIFIGYVSFNINPSELKLVTQYSAFGPTNFYRSTWHYLVSFAIFGLIVWIGHIMITIRLLSIKGSGFAVAYVWMSVAMLLFGLAVVYQVLKVASLS